MLPIGSVAGGPVEVADSRRDPVSVPLKIISQQYLILDHVKTIIYKQFESTICFL